MYPSDYLVKVPTALKQLYKDKMPEKIPTVPQNMPTSSGSSRRDSETFVPTESAKPTAGSTRFFMSVKLDNTRVIRDLQKYLDEVISHLDNTENCQVELSLEVNANSPDGFSQGVIRTVSENCRTLHVENFGFDE